MSAAMVTCRRTLGRARSLYATALGVGGFLAVAGATFAFNLAEAEGGRLSLSAVWALSASVVLPLLAAFLAMDVWSEDRQSGRIDLLLTLAVRERELVLGKFLGVWTMAMASVLLFALLSFACLLGFAPSALGGVALSEFLLALFALVVQGALWCAASVALSAMCCRGAAAAFASVVLTVVLPRAVWAGLKAWSHEGRPTFGDMPFDAFVVDVASGLVPVGMCVVYLLGAAVMLFVGTKVVAGLRLVGRGGLSCRISTIFTVLLAFVFVALASSLALRFDKTLDISAVGSQAAAFSARTRSILAESSGEVTATCFLPRNDARFREAGLMLRALKRASQDVGGARFTIRFVDPRWDLGAAERLIRRGVAMESLVFEKGRRIVVLPFADGISERVCAATVRRLTAPLPRRSICWTTGHGESGFDSYGAFGMSDIARDLAREGYENSSIDLTSVRQIPSDCALVMVAGARDDFSRAELGLLDSYLRGGGRLFVLTSVARDGGLVSLLSKWGIRPQAIQAVAGAKTLSGTDVVVSGFADHAISSSLKGLRIVLERPVSFAPSAAVSAVGGADRIEFDPIARVGSTALAAAVERGSGAGADLAIRPTRIVAVGDAGFALNGQLASRANANRDFFLNCVAYLAGTDSPEGSDGAESGVLLSGMDRTARVRHVLISSLVLPGVVFMAMVVATLRRRRRR